MAEHARADGLLVLPDGAVGSAPRAAVLVLGGSSGREEVERARILARHGVAARTLRWYDGLPAPLSRLPLERFAPAVAELTAVVPRVGLLGTSFGAEVVLLLTACDVVRADVVAALAPTAHAWESPIHDAHGSPVGEPKWTLGGSDVVGVPYLDRSWRGEAATAHDSHAESLAACDPARSAAARIPVERIDGAVLVSSGGRDLVWPSERSCREIVVRREAAGLATTHVHDADAGHQAVWPGETSRPTTLPAGGTPAASARHGAAVLKALLSMLLADPG